MNKTTIKTMNKTTW